MFSRMQNFARRHYRKFFVTAAVVGGAVLLKRYAQQKLLDWQEKEMDQFLEQSRKRQHFESTEKTCNMTVLSVVPQLTSQICQNLDSDSITLLLRNKAPNKVQLCEQLKVVGFSRIISLIYSDVLLVILLRTQVHMLGAYLYLSNKNPDDSALELNPEVQSRFLSASSHFLSAGIERLCQVKSSLSANLFARLCARRSISSSAFTNPSLTFPYQTISFIIQFSA